MEIAGMFKKEFIVEELRSRSKLDTLKELSGVLADGETRLNRDVVLNALLEREKLGSTGIGDGIAIPHGKTVDLDDLIVSFGRSKSGVDFNAMDGKPVHLFFLLMAPEHSAGQHLKALAKISRMLKDSAFRKKLMDAKSKDEIYRLIIEKGEEC
ncbi:MAG: PTS sugar transporter subunit IIA [Smithellaceae bacterium]|nr:PTS sugar transporter subunit IIA [Smithellaceae bacterium]